MSSGGELELQRMCDDEAKARGWRRFRVDGIPRRGQQSARGWPDRTYFRRGFVIVLEMKAEKDFKVSAEQQAWLEEWLAVAQRMEEFVPSVVPPVVRVAVVRPSDFDQIKGWFE